MAEKLEIASGDKFRGGKTRGQKTKIIKNLDVIQARIERLRLEDDLNYEKLAQEFIKKGYENMTASNLRTYIREKRFGLDFLYVLANIFDVTIDDLISNSNDSEIIIRSDGKSVDLYDFFSKNECYFYFPPIHNLDRKEIRKDEADVEVEAGSHIKHLLKAIWHIDANGGNRITLRVPPPEFKKKENIQYDKVYTGHLRAYDKHIYVNFLEENTKEPFQVIFNRSEIKDDLFIMGLALTIRSIEGFEDVLRLPVMHRFCLTSKELSEHGEARAREWLDIRVKLGNGKKVENPIEYSTLFRYDRYYYRLLHEENGFNPPLHLVSESV